MLLPYNDAINTFLEGLAELGVNKRLIKNKKVLCDILQKQQVFRDEEENNEADDGDSTDSNEEEETASESSQPEEFSNLRERKVKKWQRQRSKLYSTSKIKVLLDIVSVCLVLMLLTRQFDFVLKTVAFNFKVTEAHTRYCFIFRL